MEFDEIKAVELDKELTEAERDEWQAIYASYRSGSVMHASIAGVDLYRLSSENEKKVMRCLIVIPYRVKIIIPETQVYDKERSTKYYVLHSMCGANIDFVITRIDREAGFAIASRKLALSKIKQANHRRMPKEGDLIDVDVLAVSRNLCMVSYKGYDMTLAQRDITYTSVQDLHEIIHPGETRKAVVKGYYPEENVLRISIKEATPHPFDGIETRHPISSTRIATINGKYAGGVFCMLYDGVTNVLCSYLSMQYDGDYHIGDSVEIVIQKYNYDRKLVYGKILRKIRDK